MSTDIQEQEDTTKAFSEYRGMPIFSRQTANGMNEFRCPVTTVARTYMFTADSLREIRVKVDIALDTP